MWFGFERQPDVRRNASATRLRAVQTALIAMLSFSETMCAANDRQVAARQGCGRLGFIGAPINKGFVENLAGAHFIAEQHTAFLSHRRTRGAQKLQSSDKVRTQSESNTTIIKGGKMQLLLVFMEIRTPAAEPIARVLRSFVA